MIVLSLFDYSGVMVQPWADAGYETICVDTQHTEAPGKWACNLSSSNEVLDRIPGPVAFVAAFPPCTHLAVSGARWFKGKGLRALQESIGFFATCAEIVEALGAPYLIENPVSTISTYWRKPDHKFHPWHYAGIEPADNYTKETWLWTGNGFVMPEPRRGDLALLGAPDDRIHKAPPGADRANFRSKTPRGFAEAVFDANCRKEIRC